MRLGRKVTSGQSHLNSDVTVAHEGRPQGGEGTHKGCPYPITFLDVWPWEGRPQGVLLPFVFSRRLALGRAPTRGAPTDCLVSAFGPGKGTHKGCYPIVLSWRLALGRAPTRGAPTECLVLAFWPGKDTHKGCPYRMSSLGVLAWEGRPQGVPLPNVFSRRIGVGRAPTRGAPTDCFLAALPLGRAPTRGALYRLSSRGFAPGEGTHKGCPYRLSCLGVLAWEGRPQGVPLPFVFSRRFGLGRAPTRGAPTECLVLAFWPGKGTHKGCPYRMSCLGVLAWEGHPQGVPFYRMSSLGVLAWEGHPQGVPLPNVLSWRFGLGRAPTRGAPSGCLLSAFCPGKGAHKGRPYPIQAASRGFF